MKTTQAILLMLILLVAAGAVYLALRNPQAPMMPADTDHARFLGAEACVACHDGTRAEARNQNHTPRQDCTSCHGRR